MKKKWLNPQLMNLGVQETREDEHEENYRCRPDPKPQPPVVPPVQS